MNVDDAMNFITAMHAVSAWVPVRRRIWGATLRLDDAAGLDDDRIEDRPVVMLEGSDWSPTVKDYVPTEEDRAACDWEVYEEPLPPWDG